MSIAPLGQIKKRSIALGFAAISRRRTCLAACLAVEAGQGGDFLMHNMGIGMEKLSDLQIREGLIGLQGWAFEQGCIAKSFLFKDFKSAFGFMVRVAFEAEALDHHPNWENVYNSVTVRLNTHDAKGITAKDLQLAALIEAIWERQMDKGT